MPRAARTCASCPAIINHAGRCDACTKATKRNQDATRGSSTERGYTGAGHKRFRRLVLTRDPICTRCGIAWSTVADHYPLSRKQLIDTGRDPNDPDSGRGLCKPCHDRETAQHQPGGWAVRVTPPDA